MAELVVQKLRKKVKGDLEMGIKYYSLLSALNNLELSERQIQLLSFTSLRGTITPLAARKEFVKMFNSSLNSVENIKGKLSKRGFIVKIGGMYKVNPDIDLDFSKDVVLQVKLIHRGNEE